MSEIRKIDNRAVGEAEMKYQYFDICQLAEYPEVKIKINTELGNDYAEADVYFDGEKIDSFDIKEIVEDLVHKHILTIKEVKKNEAKRRKKRIKENKCPRCFQQLKKDKGTFFCEVCQRYYDSDGNKLAVITTKKENEK